MPSEPKTVRVRIPVAIFSPTEWKASAWSDAPDEENRDAVLFDVGHQFGETTHVVWIEADAPLPADIVVEGKVRE